MTTPEMTIAEAAAKAGGEVAARYFRDGVTMRSKDVANLVSDADVEAEHAIADVIRAAFPDHAILGEEAYQGRRHRRTPLGRRPDRRHEQLRPRHPPLRRLGGLLSPGAGPVRRDPEPRSATSGILSRAVRGRSTTDARRRFRTPVGSMRWIVGVGFYYDRGAMMEATLAAIGDLKRREIHGIRRFGTASLDLCAVALGQYGAYFEYTLSPWDFAAGRLFVEEAGGLVTSARGRTIAAGQDQRPRHQRRSPPGDAGGGPPVSPRGVGLNDQSARGVEAAARFLTATGKIGGRTVPLLQP